MPIEDRIEKLPDPNAPKVLDMAKCHRLIRTAPSHARFPLGDVIQEIADQLKCALEELGSVSTKITNAENQTLRYKSEADTANSEVRTMQTLLGKARDDIANLTAQLQKVTAAPQVPEPAKEAPAAKPKRRSSKVVPMTEPKAAQG